MLDTRSPPPAPPRKHYIANCRLVLGLTHTSITNKYTYLSRPCERYSSSKFYAHSFSFLLVATSLRQTVVSTFGVLRVDIIIQSYLLRKRHSPLKYPAYCHFSYGNQGFLRGGGICALPGLATGCSSSRVMNFVMRGQFAGGLTSSRIIFSGTLRCC